MNRRGEPLVALSLGGGVQSSALLVLALRGGLTIEPPSFPDVVFYMDLGADPPTTRERVEKLEEMCWDRIPFFITKEKGPSLYEKVLSELDQGRSYIPLYTPEGRPDDRHCTSNYKIRPARRFQRNYMWGEGKNWVQSWVGISWEESHRMRDAEVNYVEHRYPLVEMRLTRADCQDILIEAGMNPVAKSACFFCPFGSPFRGIEPDLEEKIMVIEEKALKIGRTFFPKRILEGGNCDGWCEL